MLKRITSLLFITLISYSAYAAVKQPELGHRLTPLKTPIEAPDFTLEDMDEEEYSFSDYRGKVVVLNFWATWCPPCRREMPSMERLYQKYKGDEFTALAINQMESGDHVFAYTGQLEVDPTFTILFDQYSLVSHVYGVKGLPTTYLIDKKGQIRFRAIGGREFDHPDVEAQIERLMAE